MKIKILLVLAVLFTSITIPLAQASELVGGEYTFKEYVDNWAEWKPISEANEEPETYTVMQGDNLYRIALNHSVPLFSLMEWNELTEDLIHPGDELIISGKEPESASSQIPTTPVAIVPEAEQPAPVPKATTPAASSPASTGGKEMTVTATAYTAYCKGCSGTTAYGIDLRANPNQKVIAVDPRIIPLGTKVWVEGYGEAVAGDTGGAIKGNKIDVFIPSHSSAMEWGVKKVKLRVLN
ncbi:3D domain-containing protein [Sporosarcina sp. 179-K 3D1 HS]|uniref:3D domain-containing protein n=1 Tax=Sporosarcina sp. 179-K 3D1 HS TaxID=3232169 RepID=UPI0039A0B2D2